MDKFMESPWFMRVVALMLAALLYTSVNFSDFELSKKADNSSQDNTEVISDVPVQVYYDNENLFVSGVPATVDVKVEGPKSIIESTKRLREFKLFIDLTDVSIGKHQVKIKHENFSEKLNVKIQPDTVDLLIEEKVTEQFTVTPEYNDKMIAEGYQVEDLTIDPRKVKITGPKDAIDKIVYVKATLDVKEKINKETSGMARVLVLDSELNKLDVKTEPETVQLSISVKNPSKKVSLNVFPKGTPPKGVKVTSLVPEVEELTVYGKESILSELEELLIPIDVDEVIKSTTVSVPIELGEGLNFVSPQIIKVKVTTEGSPAAESTAGKKDE
ncbi:YbbR domain-containing protein [Bacillus ectoiniformans]|uniref:CdaR family protein n=1 Tax=Bacillus ectoiniformans TaxID=1494429 RepID=UPI00195688B5|nr:CdaR family protein [Bacillus ectoiniformans]MBM7649510.1 YbbR domain-containing protein [Bacillus ectoiniformans]